MSRLKSRGSWFAAAYATHIWTRHKFVVCHASFVEAPLFGRPNHLKPTWVCGPLLRVARTCLDPFTRTSKEWRPPKPNSE